MIQTVTTGTSVPARYRDDLRNARFPMPIRIPDSLPATEVLEGENIFVMTEYRAMHQDIRPLKVLLLNLMPTKIVTETQIMRKLSNTPLQIEVSLLQTASHEAKNVSEQHLDTFYTTFDEIKDQRFDGMIITGAPVELLDFEDVDYWDELARIMDWSATNVHSTFHICWGAQAGIYHHYGIPKYELENKLFGVFDHEVVKPSSPRVQRLVPSAALALHRGARCRHRGAPRPRADRRLRRGRRLHREEHRQPAFLRVRPPRVRRRHAHGRVRARYRERPGHAAASPLLPERRSDASPSRHLARARAAVVYELVELLCVPGGDAGRRRAAD